MSEPPIIALTVRVSLKTIKARIIPKTTLDLSMGITREAGPIWSAR